jgi:hypothetical protein
MNKIEYANLQQTADNPKYPFTIGQLRHYMSHRHKNGLNIAVRKIGKRLFLRIDLFDAWIEKQTGGTK